ncbi:MAG TPA: cytidylate kinase-like family protein [Acidimicrobiales bacterium]|nr:cytidylate kinase-like family protein [Acidimicrobiales bacterium]
MRRHRLAYCFCIVNSSDPTYEPVITVSATYGAAGSVITPRLAAQLGLPFIDRLISADLSQQAASQEGLSAGEEENTPAGRFLSYFARAATVGTVIGPDPQLEEDEDIRARTEDALTAVRAGAPAVVLGRAAAVVLAGRPRTLHVRLDGPVEARLAWAAGIEGIDREAAARRQHETDRSRASFVKRLYRADPADPGLYHLVVDSTALGVDGTIEVIAAAAAALLRLKP